ncbi:MAG: CinA family protein [Bdellovibrionota bacterium]|nr:CinA family protein [Bdellovibrionota bacterium]
MANKMDSVIEVCAQRNWTLSFAESCTGGLVSASLCEKSGVSKIFLGSVVSYANSLKMDALGVPKHQLDCFGAVSEPVAISMATGIRNLTESTWAVSITGVAGPGGGSPEKPVGTVCFSLVGPGVSMSYKKHFEGDRNVVQNSAKDYVWEILLEQFAKDVQAS